MEITLYYFKIPFLRAEVARLALFIGDIPFKDYRFESQDTEALKKDGRLPNGLIAPFKQLPFIFSIFILQLLASLNFWRYVFTDSPGETSIHVITINAIIFSLVSFLSLIMIINNIRKL